MGSVFKMYASEMVELSPGATVLCGVIHVPVAHDELCFMNTKAGLSCFSTSLNSQIKTAFLTLSALS